MIWPIFPEIIQTPGYPGSQKASKDREPLGIAEAEFFYRPDALYGTQLTMSKHWRWKYIYNMKSSNRFNWRLTLWPCDLHSNLHAAKWKFKGQVNGHRIFLNWKLTENDEMHNFYYFYIDL